MKKGMIIGCFGCLLWLGALIIRDKEYEITQAILAFFGVCSVVAGTILTGVEKHRTWLGVALSLLSVVFGLGFVIMLCVPKRVLHDA